MKTSKQRKEFLKLALKNALMFSFNMLFVYAFQIIFGAENILAGVAICVGLTTLPDMDLGIRKYPMAGIIVGLYTMTGFVSQLALYHAWIAFPVNLIFVAVILLLSAEPIKLKTSISFLLCFVFCQANPVAPERFFMREAALFTGGVIVAATLLFKWRKRENEAEGRTLFAQIRLCSARKGYIFRCALGIAIAMAIGMLSGMKRPMWISIVVMSLTQVEFAETKQRIMYRSMATILGAAVFAGILLRYIPREYSMVFILALGYISFFITQYKYTQIINAVNALNASLYVLEPEGAIVMRVFCLAIGIFVTLAMWKLQSVLRQVPGSRELRQKTLLFPMNMKTDPM